MAPRDPSPARVVWAVCLLVMALLMAAVCGFAVVARDGATAVSSFAVYGLCAWFALGELAARPIGRRRRR